MVDRGGHIRVDDPLTALAGATRRLYQRFGGETPPAPHRPNMSDSSTIATRQSVIVEELSSAGSWQDRYRAIIRIGRELPDFPEEHRTDANKVKGCQSQVWLHAGLEPDGTVTFHGDSDASIVKGLVALVIRAFSGATPAEIVAAPTTFVDELGLSENLSQTRANGLSSVLKQIKLYGVAFSALVQRG